MTYRRTPSEGHLPGRLAGSNQSVNQINQKWYRYQKYRYLFADRRGGTTIHSKISFTDVRVVPDVGVPKYSIPIFVIRVNYDRFQAAVELSEPPKRLHIQ